MLFVRNLSPLTPLGHTHFLPAPPPPPPPPLCPRTRLPGRLLGNFIVSPVAGCTEVHLAGWELFHQSCWESGTDKFFSPQVISQMLKVASESFIYASLLFLGRFLKSLFPVGCPCKYIDSTCPKKCHKTFVHDCRSN